jgi:serine/threonine protein kinase
MMKEGKLVSNYFTREGLIYQEGGDDMTSNDYSDSMKPKKRKNLNQTLKIHILVPKKTTLKQRLKSDDVQFIDFVKNLLDIDPAKRFSAEEAMKHPWLTECVYPDTPNP